MSESTVFNFNDPRTFQDQLHDLIRAGAQTLVKAAVEAELLNYTIQFSCDSNQEKQC